MKKKDKEIPGFYTVIGRGAGQFAPCNTLKEAEGIANSCAIGNVGENYIVMKSVKAFRSCPPAVKQLKIVSGNGFNAG